VLLGALGIVLATALGLLVLRSGRAHSQEHVDPSANPVLGANNASESGERTPGLSQGPGNGRELVATTDHQMQGNGREEESPQQVHTWEEVYLESTPEELVSARNERRKQLSTTKRAALGELIEEGIWEDPDWEFTDPNAIYMTSIDQGRRTVVHLPRRRFPEIYRLRDEVEWLSEATGEADALRRMREDAILRANAIRTGED